MKLKIISNLHTLDDVKIDTLEIELTKYPKSVNNFKTVLKYFFKSFKYDYIILNYVPFDVFSFALLKLLCPFNRCKLVTLDLMLGQTSGFKQGFIRTIKIILLKKISFFMTYYKNWKAISELYKIPDDKFKYIPFKINSYELIIKTEVTDDGYIFCGGKSYRDYQTFIEAVTELPYPIKIVTPDNLEIEEHCSYIDEGNLPGNVELIRDDGTPESFIRLMAASKFVVIPIKKSSIKASGLGVYIMAMALKKAVIISSGPAVDDILSEEKAVIVPPEDTHELREAMRKLYDEDQYRESVALHGYNYAINLKGEEKLKNSLMRIILDDTSESRS